VEGLTIWSGGGIPRLESGNCGPTASAAGTANTEGTRQAPAAFAATQQRQSNPRVQPAESLKCARGVGAWGGGSKLRDRWLGKLATETVADDIYGIARSGGGVGGIGRMRNACAVPPSRQAIARDPVGFGFSPASSVPCISYFAVGILPWWCGVSHFRGARAGRDQSNPRAKGADNVMDHQDRGSSTRSVCT
jgi:hypothetical protein